MTDLLLTHGSYFLITLMLILTGAGLPIPEEVPIIAAGILAAHRALDPWLAFGCCLFGAVVGDSIIYWIGYHFGRGVLKERHWWTRWFTPEREAQVEDQFRRHGLKVFFVARFLVGIRAPVYLTAGILRVSYRRFLLIDLLCAAAVVGVFFSLTYFFGQHIVKLVREAELWATLGVLLTAGAIGFYLWRRHLRKKKILALQERPVCEKLTLSDAQVDEIEELV